MDVNYIKKSKDEKYQLVYHLTDEDLGLFTEENIKNGELK